MTKVLLTTIKALLSSKKFVAALIAALVWVAGKVGLSVDTETMAGIVGPVVAYVLGQGIADIGKAKAKEPTKPVGDDSEAPLSL